MRALRIECSASTNICASEVALAHPCPCNRAPESSPSFFVMFAVQFQRHSTGSKCTACIIGYGFPGHRLTQPVCHPTETLLKSAPDRMIAPVLPATLMACLLPTGKTSVAPTREFDS